MSSALEIREFEKGRRNHFHDSGYQLLPEIVSKSECDAIAAELTGLFQSREKTSQKRIGGIRNLLWTNSTVAELANSARFVALIEGLAGRPAFPVRAVFFDKTVETNWSVPWHQDLTITVAERLDTSGFSPWSVKEGIVHVQPPCEILAGMVALRVHLDDCDAGNGALRIIPSSHLAGELSTEEISAWTSERSQVVCELPKGGALAMRPLLLHASTRTTNPTHRRVLHIDYATDNLPNGLKWFEQ